MVRSPCEKINVKRGVWTTEEDTKKLAFGSKHGSGNWSSVPKKARHKRCGKSCRLRWTNCPRPDPKSDNFTTQEEDLIIKLHAAIGSRWSIIAQQLPGRTDNDVKNYWNTKLKKKLSQMGIDPVTHKPFSKLIADYGNIGGCQKPSTRIGSFNKELKNAMMSKSEPHQTLKQGFTNINNQPKLPHKMETTGNDFLLNRTHSDNVSMNLNQFQAMPMVSGASNCIDFENETIPASMFGEDCLSKTSSPSTPSTCSTSAFSWNDFLLEDAFTPLENQEHDIMVSKDLVSQPEKVTKQSRNNKGVKSLQASTSEFQFSSSSDISFIEAMLRQENEMFLSFPHLMEEPKPILTTQFCCEKMSEKEEESSMVAISLYRGNLHRVPDVPRRWPMPAPKITLKDFKTLLARRSKALSRLQASNPNRNPNPNPLSNGSQPQPPPTVIVTVTVNHGEGPSTVPQEHHNRKEPPLVAVSKPLGGSDSPVDVKIKVEDLGKKPPDAVAASTEKQTQTVTENADLLNEKEKRKKEIEEKLHGLNDNKHNLVLLLKQILNAEEELKRRNSMQVAVMRGPSVAPQGDGTNDTGSTIRLMAPRLGSEGNLAGDVDGGEGDDFANHTLHSRHVLQPSSMSPSSESPLRRTPSVQPNVISLPSRANMGAAGSPSRFALSGHQGNPMNLPSVSVSGTSYIASSPSPAASGGTSVFRDARQPSPWK
ncbi:hypothetical protein VNO78_02932 [Psophocarpus tetragonolobus]|uniref:Uncharacterized protein n=1 Tax=Psophocarpus tetragonolobus TaxID=3891 RepID=A0AAN9XVM8_PSOTE